ncbi:unnamed protein product [Mytilus edulis]|uniref:Uncharacterized protein n=1 Tax=Mytilus edulis TaxID=6550 RepID=A0A8S3QF34_MYTED|nr:unnamed protein product [Mytilus edulis]
MKKNRDQVENTNPKVQLWTNKTPERSTSRSKNPTIGCETFDRILKTGKELLANWKFLVEENGHAIETAINKLQNMQPSELSDNRTRKEIEQHIDFHHADRNVMQKCMNHLQWSMQDRLNFLRDQQKFLLDYQNTLEHIFNSFEKSKQSRVPDPFSKFILDVKLNHYHMFNEELLITSKERANKNARRLIETNTISIGNTNVYMGRLGTANIMTPIYEDRFELDECFTGKCFDPHCTCYRSESVLSFENHELDIECQLYAFEENSKRNENDVRKEGLTHELHKQSQKSKIPIPVKQLPYKKMKHMNESSATQLKLPPLLANKPIKHTDESSSTQPKLPPLLPTKMKYMNESSSTQLKPPALLPNINNVDESYSAPIKSPNKKITSCWEPLKLPPLLPGQKQNCKVSNCPVIPPKILQPLKMLPQNIKRTLNINKDRNEKKEKTKVMSMRPRPKSALRTIAGTSASNDISNVNSELAMDKMSWITVPRERNYRYSKLQKDSTKDCFIPKGPGDKVSKVIYERYLTLRKQVSNTGKQTETEKSDNCPEFNQHRTKLDIKVANKYAAEENFDKVFDQDTTIVQSEGGTGNDCQYATNQSPFSDWQVTNIGLESEIETKYVPMPPKTPKPKTLNTRINQYSRKRS